MIASAAYIGRPCGRMQPHAELCKCMRCNANYANACKKKKKKKRNKKLRIIKINTSSPAPSSPAVQRRRRKYDISIWERQGYGRNHVKPPRSRLSPTAEDDPSVYEVIRPYTPVYKKKKKD